MIDRQGGDSIRLRKPDVHGDTSALPLVEVIGAPENHTSALGTEMEAQMRFATCVSASLAEYADVLAFMPVDP